jgi:predicted Fe-Mo cluster-binding NifX family protein
MKVLCCGSRTFTDLKVIISAFETLLKEGPIDSVIQGGAMGADYFSSLEAARRGIKVFEFPAEWEKYGRSAGYVRNAQMLKENPDVVLAFQVGKSPGTENMVQIAQKKGIRVIIYKEGR